MGITTSTKIHRRDKPLTAHQVRHIMRSLLPWFHLRVPRAIFTNMELEMALGNSELPTQGDADKSAGRMETMAAAPEPAVRDEGFLRYRAALIFSSQAL